MIQEFKVGDADEIRIQRSLAKEQLDVEIPLRSAGAYTSPMNPWPREGETETRDTAFAVQKRKIHWKRQGQGNLWDQYGDSSSAASPSVSAEEGGKGRRIMSEKANQWGPWSSHEPGNKYAHPPQPHSLHQANRGEGRWSKRASDVRQSQPEFGTTVPLSGTRLPATIMPGSIKGYDSSDWDGQCGLPLLQDPCVGDPNYEIWRRVDTRSYPIRERRQPTPTLKVP